MQGSLRSFESRRTSGIRVVVLVALLGLVADHALGAAPIRIETKKAETPAGPVVNGLTLSLSASKSETFMQRDGKNAEAVALKLTITNVSEGPIKFNAFDFPMSRIKSEVKAPDADSVR